MSGYSMTRSFSPVGAREEKSQGNLRAKLQVERHFAQTVEQVAINSLAGAGRGGDFSSAKADRLKGEDFTVLPFSLALCRPERFLRLHRSGKPVSGLFQPA